MIFPVEVLEAILQRCDRADLERWKSVSSTWCAVINRIIAKETELPYKKCLRVIPEDMWSSVFDPQWDSVFDKTSTNVRYISSWRTLLKEMLNLMLGPELNPTNNNDVYRNVKDYSHVWAKLWKSWMGWRALIHVEPTIHPYDAMISSEPGDRITCIASLNEIVGVGSFDGYVKLFRIVDSHVDVFSIIDVKQPVESLQLLKAVESILVVTSGINAQRTYSITCICKETGEIQRVYSPSGWTCANPCNGSVYTIFFDQSSFEQSTAFRGGRMIPKTFEIPPPRNNFSLDSVVAIGADLDQMLLWTKGNTHYVYMIHENKVITRYLSVKQPLIPVRRYVIFKPLVVACIGELGDFGFSVNGSEWKVYDLFKRFCAPVTAILFHVCVLVLGLESGEVHIFNVKNVESLGNLNFDEIKSIKRHLSTNPIIALSVTEDDSAQWIVAATIEYLHFMKFAFS